MSNYMTEVNFKSDSRDQVNSGFILALVPIPERHRVMMRASYLSNTGWRPSYAIDRAVNEWRNGLTQLW